MQNLVITLFIVSLGNTCLNGEGKIVQNNTLYDKDTSGTDNWCNKCHEVCWCPDWRRTTYGRSTQATECVTLCTKMGCVSDLSLNRVVGEFQYGTKIRNFTAMFNLTVG